MSEATDQIDRRNRSVEPCTTSTQIARAIADRLGRDVPALEPLYRAVDPEALDALSTTLSIAFDYDEYRIVVDEEGLFTIADRDR